VILIFYFIAFFIVLPVAVGIWWSKASKFHDSGVRLDSFGIWESFVKPDMDIKYLLHLIGASAELECVNGCCSMLTLVTRASNLTIFFFCFQAT
jgi:preprotein translocase subunit Sec63